MEVILKDGVRKKYEQPMAIIDIAKDISEGLARMACAAELDGEVVDLRTEIDGEHQLNILTFDSEGGKAAYRHTASHVLAQAVKRLYPEAKCAIGPSIEDGFYYDFDMESLDRETLDKIEKEIKKDLPSRLHARRQMLRVLYPVKEVPTAAAGRKRGTKEVDLVAKLFDEYGVKYADRKGGYTRIIKIGQRKGDGALEVVLELV